jgi:4-deoxy-L-threo-5-hexosulose-uronate ketol-isomerase
MPERDAMHYLPTPAEARRMTADELRAAFLMQGLFVPGGVTLRHVHLDRVVLGGAVPTDRPLRLDAPAWLGAEFFAERRELAVLNVGGSGAVDAGGTRYSLDKRDVLYIGRGQREILFASAQPTAPARFYIVSYPAHADYPTTLVRHADVAGEEIGTAERANRRRIARYIHLEGVRSAQLVMGVTTLAPGSVWNTMPAHTHHRRSEIYLYFDLPPDAMVVHLLGTPTDTRHLVVRDGEAVLSPGWSVHSGCGTASYSFCWAMGGENQVYTDMQPVDMGEIR